MKLYKIFKRHYSPKDSEEWIDYFLVARDSEEVFNYLDDKENGGTWNDRNDESDLLDIYNENFEVIGQETYKEKMIRLGGEFFDEDADINDLFYGLTLCGWYEEKNSKDLYQEVEVLKRLNMIKFISEQEYEKFIKSEKIKSF